MVHSLLDRPLEPDALADAPDDDDRLDLVFTALSDRTRRHVLRTLIDGPTGFSVGELAHPHGMSLTGFMKHLRVLEDAGLIARSKQGRVVRCDLQAAPLQEAAVWLSRYEKFWTDRFDALGRFLQQRQETRPWPDPPDPLVPKSPAAARPNRSANRPRSASNAATRPRSPKSGARGPTRRR